MFHHNLPSFILVSYLIDVMCSLRGELWFLPLEDLVFCSHYAQWCTGGKVRHLGLSVQLVNSIHPCVIFVDNQTHGEMWNSHQLFWRLQLCNLEKCSAAMEVFFLVSNFTHQYQFVNCLQGRFVKSEKTTFDVIEVFQGCSDIKVPLHKKNPFSFSSCSSSWMSFTVHNDAFAKLSHSQSGKFVCMMCDIAARLEANPGPSWIQIVSNIWNLVIHFLMEKIYQTQIIIQSIRFYMHIKTCLKEIFKPLAMLAAWFEEWWCLPLECLIQWLPFCPVCPKPLFMTCKTNSHHPQLHCLQC